MEDVIDPEPTGAKIGLNIGYLVNEETRSNVELEKDLQFAMRLIQDAGALALSLQPDAEGTFKADHTRVSNADVQVQRFMEDAIRAAYPTYAILAEEETSVAGTRGHLGPEPEDADGVWIIDPIDGTDSYLRSMPTYAICLGLARQGIAELGLVYLPVARELYWATVDGRSGVNQRPLRPLTPERLTHDSMMLVTSTLHKFARNDFPGKVRSYGSTAAHLCFVAAGKVDAAILSHVNIWDVFSGMVLLEAVGGGLFTPHGNRFLWADMLTRWAKTPTLIAAHPATVPAIVANLHPRRGG